MAARLVHLWRAHVLRWCRWLGDSGLSPDDLAQEVLLAMLQHLHRVRQPEQFARWLHSLTWRVVRGERRRAWFRRRRSMPDGEPAGSDADPSRQLDAARRARHVQAVLQALPMASRRLLGLRYLEGLSRQEMVDLLGMAPGTLGRQLSDARRQFEAEARRQGLQPSGTEPADEGDCHA